MKTQIKNRYTGAVLFECDVPDTVLSGLATRHALEKAVGAGADLSGANLSYADLSGANLRYADLSYADLSGANLSYADLSGANLSGADLGFGEALGNRPYFTIGPIGSRNSILTLWITDNGAFVQAGCFTGTIDEFAAEVEKTHGDSDHGKEYRMAILMMESHAALWGEK